MATMNDVAKEAGVSIASVSAVVNGKSGEVGSETKRRIVAAITKTGYKPNRAARQLATGTYNTILVSVEYPTLHALSIPNFVSVLSGISDAATVAGLDILLPTSMGPGNLADTAESLVSRGVDGAVFIGPVPMKQRVIRAIDNSSVPIVCADSYRGFTRTCTVDYDNVSGMRKAMQRLISAGHERIVYIAHPPTFQCFMDRMQAFCEVMQEHNLTVDENSICIVNGPRVELCVSDIISRPEPPTAIVISEGEQGASVWSALTNAGVRIPDDMSLVICDKLPDGHPGSDTVIQVNTGQGYELGKATAELLLDVIKGEKESPLNVRLPIELLPL